VPSLAANGSCIPAAMFETFGPRARVRLMIAWRFARICSMVTPRKASLIPSARIRTSIFVARRGYTIRWVVEWSGAPAAGAAPQNLTGCG
jgi:hypothetical protein